MTEEDREDREERDPADPRGDPFERLDGDRDGNPFAHLDGPGTADGPVGRAGEATDPVDDAAHPGSGALDLFDDGAGAIDGRSGADGDRAESTRADPAGDPAATDPFGEFEARDGDPFEAAGGAFERVDVGDVDPDEVWDSIASDGDATDGVAATDDAHVAESRYADVSKHEFCERCEYFSSPPDVGCAHGSAEIVEFLDSETIRLLNCPVVAERRRIEDGE
ncbi:hypothetical protein [Halomicrobium urmianum]|uniref:hypothetical protein n=1 Tax=Halomicrobium urmianum TaxID=1586233 RepID=UPI001CD92A4E|nr:hypothetical protein [Halomicrobium urmianum]